MCDLFSEKAWTDKANIGDGVYSFGSPFERPIRESRQVNFNIIDIYLRIFNILMLTKIFTNKQGGAVLFDGIQIDRLGESHRNVHADQKWWKYKVNFN